MVDFPTRSEFAYSKGQGGVPIIGPPKKLTPSEIADLFSDLGKLMRREKAAVALVTGLRVRLASTRQIANDAEHVIASACSFLASLNLEGGEAVDQLEALKAIGEKLREEARRPECVDVPLEPLPE